MAESNEQMLKDVLKALVHGAKCHYAPVYGGVILLEKDGERSKQKIDIGTFLHLQSDGLVDLVKHYGSGTHAIFHGIVNSYSINSKGREYLIKEN